MFFKHALYGPYGILRGGLLIAKSLQHHLKKKKKIWDSKKQRTVITGMQITL